MRGARSAEDPVTVDVRSDASRSSLGWVRAIFTGLGTVVGLAVLLVWVPDLVLTRLTGLERSTRVTIATAWFCVALGLAAWALRRCQARGLI